MKYLPVVLRVSAVALAVWGLIEVGRRAANFGALTARWLLAADPHTLELVFDTAQLLIVCLTGVAVAAIIAWVNVRSYKGN